VPTQPNAFPRCPPDRCGDAARRYGGNGQLITKRPRGPDHRLVKIHRTYTIQEAANVLGVHQHTVRAWIRNDLPLVDDKRPCLVRGLDLISYLKRRRARNKRPCGPGQIYCVKCRIPQTPASDMVDYIPRTDRTGDLIGFCPRCEKLIYRRISWVRFDEVCETLEVRIVQPHLRISDSASPP
jgi:hypothetical protein